MKRLLFTFVALGIMACLSSVASAATPTLHITTEPKQVIDYDDYNGSYITGDTTIGWNAGGDVAIVRCYIDDILAPEDHGGYLVNACNTNIMGNGGAGELGYGRGAMKISALQWRQVHKITIEACSIDNDCIRQDRNVEYKKWLPQVALGNKPEPVTTLDHATFDYRWLHRADEFKMNLDGIDYKDSMNITKNSNDTIDVYNLSAGAHYLVISRCLDGNCATDSYAWVVRPSVVTPPTCQQLGNCPVDDPKTCKELGTCPTDDPKTCEQLGNCPVDNPKTCKELGNCPVGPPTGKLDESIYKDTSKTYLVSTVADVNKLKAPKKPICKTSKQKRSKACKTPRKMNIRLNANVLFAFDSSVLTSSGKKTLKALSKKLHRFGVKSMVYTGNASSEGDDAYNYKLALSRAKSVNSAMHKALGKKVKSTVKSNGEKRPVATNTTESGRKKNRNVQVAVTLKR